MNNELPTPLGDLIYVKLVGKKSALGQDTWRTMGEVLAIGSEVKVVQPGQFIGFELQDKPEFVDMKGEMHHWVKEKDALAIIPKSWTE